jgi:uncharacterized membrane protein YbhN (UPF0104 family)
VNKRLIVALSKYLLAFGLLAWVVSKIWAPENGPGLKDIWQKHFVQGEPIRWDFLLLGTAIYIGSVLLTLMRWYLLVRAQDLPFTKANALRLGMIGQFFNAFMPGSVGGDVIRAAYLARSQDRRTVAVATVLMDRAIALWGLIWFVALLGGAFWAAGMLDGSAEGPAKTIVRIAGIIVVATSLVWIALGYLPPRRAEIFAGRLSRIPKVGATLAELWRAVWIYRLRPRAIALTLLLSWVGHVGFVTSFYCFARTLWDGSNAMPTLTEHFLLVPIGLVIQAAPLFPGGIGIGELGFGGLYKLFAGPGAMMIGVLGSFVMRVVNLVLGLAGLVVYLRMRTDLRPARPVSEPVVPAAHTPAGKTDAIQTGDALWGAAPNTNVQVG